MTASLPREKQSPYLAVFDVKTSDCEITTVASTSECAKYRHDPSNETSTSSQNIITGYSAANARARSDIGTDPEDRATPQPPASENDQGYPDACDDEYELDEQSRSTMQTEQQEQSERSTIQDDGALSTAPSIIEQTIVPDATRPIQRVHRQDGDGDAEGGSDARPSDGTAPTTIRSSSGAGGCVITPDELGPYDILCGRDKESFNYVGNRRFRVSLGLSIPAYLAATTKSQKAAVIGQMVRELSNGAGARFLQREERQQRPGGGGAPASTTQQQHYYYVELSVSQARKKVGHALRDMAVARQEVRMRRAHAAAKNKKRQDDEGGTGTARSPPQGDDSDDDGTTMTGGPKKNGYDEYEGDGATGDQAPDDDGDDDDLGDSLSSLLPHMLSDLDDSATNDGNTDMEPLPAFSGSNSAQEKPLPRPPPPPPPQHPQYHPQYHPQVHRSYEPSLLLQLQHQQRNSAAYINSYNNSYYYHHFHHHHHFVHHRNNIGPPPPPTGQPPSGGFGGGWPCYNNNHHHPPHP